MALRYAAWLPSASGRGPAAGSDLCWFSGVRAGSMPSLTHASRRYLPGPGPSTDRLLPGALRGSGMDSVTPPHRRRRPEVILYPKNLCCQSKTPLPSQRQGLLVALSNVVRTALTSPLAQGTRTAKNRKMLRLKATVETHRLQLPGIRMPGRPEQSAGSGLAMAFSRKLSPLAERINRMPVR
jgi:hypothetical protein